MCEAVRALVRLDTPGPDGTTQRQHLLQAEKQTKRKLLKEPTVPPEGLRYWRWFWELERGRKDNGFGPVPFSYTDIAAWAQLMREAPGPEDIRILQAMDRARLSEANKVKPS